MTRHTICVRIDSEADLTAKRAERFVFHAIDTVRANISACLQEGVINGASAKALAGSTMYVALQSPTWTDAKIAEELTSLRRTVEDTLFDKMKGKTCHEFARELVEVFMQSKLTDPEARHRFGKLWDAMP
jgi:hypothetical protein